MSQAAATQVTNPVARHGVHSTGCIADTDTQVREELWPHYEVMWTGRRRARLGPDQPGDVRPRGLAAGSL